MKRRWTTTLASLFCLISVVGKTTPTSYSYVVNAFLVQQLAQIRTHTHHPIIKSVNVTIDINQGFSAQCTLYVILAQVDRTTHKTFFVNAAIED